jgi:hypothetical protein
MDPSAVAMVKTMSIPTNINKILYVQHILGICVIPFMNSGIPPLIPLTKALIKVS